LTFTSCDLIVPLSAVACSAMVAPPRKITPDKTPASARQTIVNRSECVSLTTRPRISVMALSATPSKMPAKIRKSVAAKYQVNTTRVVNATTPMPPTDMAQARSLRFRTGPLAETATSILSNMPFGSLPPNLSGIKQRSQPE